MGLIGDVIGGVGQLAAGVIGGSATRRALNKNRDIVAMQKQRSQDWYDQEYNADFTQRSDAQAALNRTRDILKERYKAAAGAAAVGGATDESVAQQKAAANQVLADTASNIAERADAYKEQVRANYEAQQGAAEAQEIGINQAKAQAVQQAVQGMGQAAQEFGKII